MVEDELRGVRGAPRRGHARQGQGGLAGLDADLRGEVDHARRGQADHRLVVGGERFPGDGVDDRLALFAPSAVVEEGGEVGGQHRPPLVADGGDVEGAAAQLRGEIGVDRAHRVRRRHERGDGGPVARAGGRRQLSRRLQRARAGVEQEVDRLQPQRHG